MRQCRLSFAFCALITTTSIFSDTTTAADTLASLFPAMGENDLHTLVSEKQVTRHYFENVTPNWLPSTELRAELSEDISQIRTTIGVETVYLITPEAIGWRPATDFREDTFRRTVLDTLLSISTIKDIEYYSVTRDRVRTLFTESYRIDDPENMLRLPDPVAGEMPAELAVYAFQRDTTFGKQVNRIVYRQIAAEVSLSMTNLTPLRYGFIRVAGKEQMQIHLHLTPLEQALVFYGCVVVRVPRLFGLVRSSTESFYNRIHALYSWFVHELAEKASAIRRTDGEG